MDLDLTTFTDDDLDALRQQVAAERERRDALATIPGMVGDLARRYMDGGGDVSDLTAAITGDA